MQTARLPHVAARALWAASLFLLPTLATWAEVVVKVEHHDAASATKEFNFEGMSGPLSEGDDSTGNVKFTLVDGQADGNSAAPEALFDGKAPDEEDQPDKNFFFKDGDDGGRLLLDLLETKPIGQIETYSWHPNTRAPQVYKLYGSDGKDAGFVKEPKRPQDPAQCGWKLIGSVDTRKEFGMDGGQYAASFQDKDGRSVGSYRYLLFDVSRTEADDDFGNTFFSEINVNDPDDDTAPAAQDGVTMEHNDGDDATKEFKFKSVRGIAEGKFDGTVTVVDGQADEGSAPPAALCDGEVPDEEDQPDKNFFFQAGDEGGRVLFDLGEATPLDEVDTYSWHPNTRAPQVYKLYGSDGSDDGFNKTPKYPQDPAFHGWKLLGTVDTRTKFGMAGGQYGVSVKGKDGKSLGTYRYLLFDVSRTEGDDTYGNTFFSEVNLIGGAAAAPAKETP